MKHWHCSLFGHNYIVTKRVTSHVKEFCCKHCKRQVTTNGQGKLTPLTPKYKEINSVLGNYYMRRRSKRSSVILDH